MDVSVALAVRNNERHLEALLASLARQTQRPLELVVTDDASDDSSPEILAEFAARAPYPVRVERFETRRGHVEAFIAAARRCSGDAVALCDADDVWLERKLEVCTRELGRDGVTLVMHTSTVVDAELRPLGREWPPIASTRLVPPLGLVGLDVHTPGMTLLFRRDLLEVAEFDDRPRSRYGHDDRMLHDEWIFFVAGALGSVRLVAEPLVLYRQHGSNASGGVIDDARRRSLRPAVDHYRQAAAYTGECAAYLERTAARARDNRVAERLAASAGEYARISRNWERREALYAAAGRRARAQLLRDLIAGRAYAARATGGFGRAALVKDVAGVALRV
jgi:glycosyltransferase involved in cell wall biosynthesis